MIDILPAQPRYHGKPDRRVVLLRMFVLFGFTRLDHDDS